ncbi:MAG TPA: HAMP domain-containing protein [Geobacteraceae bacterium]|nr:HAMP domain-containing protein [Geobacteraceae bacterium]
MLRTLSSRAIVPVALAVTGFVVVCCILLFSVMKTDMINDTITHETNLTDTVTKSTRYAMLKSDRETLRNIIANVGDQKGVEHLRIFNKKGLVMFSRDPREVSRFVDKKSAGCIGCHAGPVPTSSIGSMERVRRFVNERGVAVIAITAPIYNEPACYTAQCHFHTAEQKILGTLDIGLSAAPLLSTLAVMRGRMIIFSIMVLLLTVGGVAALLRRQVFIPLREITDFTSDINNGNLTRELTGISGELSDLAQNIRAVALQLRNAVQEIEELKKHPEQTKE